MKNSNIQTYRLCSMIIEYEEYNSELQFISIWYRRCNWARNNPHFGVLIGNNCVQYNEKKKKKIDNLSTTNSTQPDEVTSTLHKILNTLTLQFEKS